MLHWLKIIITSLNVTACPPEQKKDMEKFVWSFNRGSTGEINKVNELETQPITDRVEQQRKWNAESLMVFAAGSVDRMVLAESCRQTLISEFQKGLCRNDDFEWESGLCVGK